MTKNPFKFGSIVDSKYFTNRKSELKQLQGIINSDVHLILISPRRFGKSSLIHKIVTELNRPVISIDLQIITSEIDLAEQILNRVYKYFPFQKLKNELKSFRISPTISFNPVSGDVNVHFESQKASEIAIEDVLGLLNQLSTPKKKLIVVFDEFQEIRNISKNLVNKMRSLLQYHQDINYVFLGSQESMMRDIFEKHSSPFYHFGSLFVLDKIREPDFREYITNGLSPLWTDKQKVEEIAAAILETTHSHPYYTQQLAWHVWELQDKDFKNESPVDSAVDMILMNHDRDFERLWYSLNNTDKKVLIGLATTKLQPTSADFLLTSNVRSTSTVQSSLDRMLNNGIILKAGSKYECEDPFFTKWIYHKRSDY